MNYLGHLYLSGENEQLLIGNFIGDYVKGRQYENYPSLVKEGILFHRSIDSFTDHNEYWKQIKDMLKPIYKKYAGVVADIFVDHFLAKNWMQFSDIHLNWYSKWVYAVFLKNFEILPLQVQSFVPYLIQHRRLQSYAKIKGIERSLQIMSFRTSLPDYTMKAIAFLKDNYIELEELSMQFLHETDYNKKAIKDNINSLDQIQVKY